MGGADKPALPVGGQPMLTRVLAAVHDAEPRVWSARPARPARPTCLVTREDPPGGGPVAATAAGLALVPPDTTCVALLAADLPLLTGEAVGVLRRDRRVGADAGAVCRDAEGRRQLAVRGVADVGAARRARPAGRRRGGELRRASVRGADGRAAGRPSCPGPAAARRPWFDCDTDDDLRRAEEWAR